MTPDPPVEARPSQAQATRNQFAGTCGGSRWRYVGGDLLGWWEVCRGCKACEGQTTEARARVAIVMRGSRARVEGTPTEIQTNPDGTWLRLEDCDAKPPIQVVRLESCCSLELVT